MTGRLSSLVLLFVILLSCDGRVDESQLESNNKGIEIAEESIDGSKFVDFELTGEKEVIEEEGYNSVIIDGEAQEILIYEGQLMATTKLDDGYMLFFEPYNYWDDDLEMTIDSETNFSVTLQISQKQADYLGFFEESSETDDIKWDYFENLFKVSMYIDENQNNIPLKFEDLGKTEWDG